MIYIINEVKIEDGDMIHSVFFTDEFNSIVEKLESEKTLSEFVFEPDVNIHSIFTDEDIENTAEEDYESLEKNSKFYEKDNIKKVMARIFGFFDMYDGDGGYVNYLEIDNNNVAVTTYKDDDDCFDDINVCTENIERESDETHILFFYDQAEEKDAFKVIVKNSSEEIAEEIEDCLRELNEQIEDLIREGEDTDGVLPFMYNSDSNVYNLKLFNNYNRKNKDDLTESNQYKIYTHYLIIRGDNDIEEHIIMPRPEDADH